MDEIWDFFLFPGDFMTRLGIEKVSSGFDSEESGWPECASCVQRFYAFLQFSLGIVYRWEQVTRQKIREWNEAKQMTVKSK